MVQLPTELTDSMKGGAKKQRDWRPFLLYGFAGLTFLNAFLLLSINGRVNRIISTQRPTLVELQNGSAVRVDVKSSISRQPETINRFIRTIFPLGMNWSATLPDGEEDKGVSVGEGVVPTPLWQMSATLETDFRVGWLTFMAQELDPSMVLSGKQERILKIRSVSQPVEIAPGEWEVDLIADWMLFTPQDRRGLAIEFNKRIHLQAIPPQLSPLGEDASPLERALYNVQSAGLEIQDIKEIVND